MQLDDWGGGTRVGKKYKKFVKDDQKTRGYFHVWMLCLTPDIPLLSHSVPDAAAGPDERLGPR